MSLGTRIAETRRKENITQEQFAQMLNVTRQSVSRWESDIAFPEMDKLVKISDILHVSCDYLLKDTSDTEETKVNPITRLLKNSVGKKVELTLFEEFEDYDLLGKECCIIDFDGMWTEVEIYHPKKANSRKLIQLSAISSIEFVEGD